MVVLVGFCQFSNSLFVFLFCFIPYRLCFWNLVTRVRGFDGCQAARFSGSVGWGGDEGVVNDLW